MIENSLWVEKYRPTELKDYVTNPDFRKRCEEWIRNDEIENMTLYGPAGSGKTTAGKMLVKNINASLLYINASDENGIDTIRTKIKSYASSVGFDKWKVVILDEADFLTAEAQAALRGITEQFSAHCRFILTCNYPEKLIPALKSRCTPQEIIPPNKKSVAARLAYILSAEDVKFKTEDIVKIVDSTYPDMRAAISNIQKYSYDGELVIPTTIERNIWCEDIVKELISNNSAYDIFKNIRQLIADNKIRMFDDLFKYLYDNLERLSDSSRANILLLIADCQFKSALVVDKEITVMAMITNLIQQIKETK